MFKFNKVVLVEVQFVWMARTNLVDRFFMEKENPGIIYKFELYLCAA